VFRYLFSRPRSLFLLLAIICFGMLAFGVLYLQEVVGLAPCPMCIVQRDALIVVGVLCLIAACFRGRGARAIWGVLAIVVAGFGGFTAARQSWLQWHPPMFATCGRDLNGMIAAFPLREVFPMVFRGAGDDCSQIDWTFLGGSIANWSFVWFVIAIVAILALLIWGGRRRSAWRF
jgi:disulfide bond formation protein DsbB